MSTEAPVPYKPVSREGRPFIIGATGGIGPHYVSRIAETSEVFAGYRKPQDRVVDDEYELSSRKVKEVLGYEPRVSFDGSIRRTREYVSKNGLIRTSRLYK